MLLYICRSEVQSRRHPSFKVSVAPGPMEGPRGDSDSLAFQLQVAFGVGYFVSACPAWRRPGRLQHCSGCVCETVCRRVSVQTGGPSEDHPHGGGRVASVCWGPKQNEKRKGTFDLCLSWNVSSSSEALNHQRSWFLGLHTHTGVITLSAPLVLRPSGTDGAFLGLQLADSSPRYFSDPVIM